MALDHFRLAMVPAHPTIKTVYGALSGAQSAPAAEQVMAHAVLFNEMCRELRLDPGELLDGARRLARHAEDHLSIELRAMREFIRKELNK